MKITLIGARLSKNLGGPSMYSAVKSLIDQNFEHAEITMLTIYKTIKDDQLLQERYGIKILPYRVNLWTLPMIILSKLTGLVVGPKEQRDFFHAIQQADLFIDIWGIQFADSLGKNSFIIRFTDGFHYLIAKITKKPVIKFTADLGPFKTFWNRLFAKYYLNSHVDTILARNETTLTDLKNLGITTPITVVPDTAFLLKVEPNTKSREFADLKNSPLVGLSISYQAKNRAANPEHYFSVMEKLIHHLIEKISATVVLLPNELATNKNDDQVIANELKTRVHNDHCIVADVEGLIAQEIKAIINECDIIISARYHTIVASLSLGIPTLAIGWHQKYAGVLRYCGQEEKVIDISTISTDELLIQVDTLWRDREEIRKVIEKNIPEIKKQIQKTATNVFNDVK